MRQLPPNLMSKYDKDLSAYSPKIKLFHFWGIDLCYVIPQGIEILHFCQIIVNSDKMMYFKIIGF